MQRFRKTLTTFFCNTVTASWENFVFKRSRCVGLKSRKCAPTVPVELLSESLTFLKQCFWFFSFLKKSMFFGYPLFRQNLSAGGWKWYIFRLIGVDFSFFLSFIRDSFNRERSINPCFQEQVLLSLTHFCFTHDMIVSGTFTFTGYHTWCYRRTFNTLT